MFIMSLAGAWHCAIPGLEGTLHLPGTLDESGLGFPDHPEQQWKVDEVRRIGFYREGDPIVTRLTRKFVFEGEARITRHISWAPPEGMRLFVDVDRARSLRLFVNGKEAPQAVPAGLSSPRSFEISGLATGKDDLLFFSDNSYPGGPRDAIVFSSAASDETQTNWNGLLGEIRLRAEKPVFLQAVRVYPGEDQVTLEAELNAAQAWQGVLRFRSDALAQTHTLAAEVPAGVTVVRTCAPLKKDALRWDLEAGNLYSLTAEGDGLDPFETRFGLRVFRAQDGTLTLNGRRIFLRSEANCAVFPETGYCPMSVSAWKEILSRYRAYGVNCMRFHSHCPPEAAFIAADELGMLMQPELSHWDPVHAFSSPESQSFYRAELLGILRHLANHPSFVMLTFGNELHADTEGHAFMDTLLRLARKTDATRLYANGSNVHYGAIGTDPASDFYASMSWRGMEMRATCDGMRGWLNEEYPNSRHNYDATMAAIRQESAMPVFSFEVGQYEVLPDFSETADWQGVTRPDNLLHIQKKVAEKGLQPVWSRMVEATGESSLLCYRAEVESALRTKDYSGISLLGIQDFPGQGTALVGMMNARLQPKPFSFARPERFSAFFRDVLPMALLERFTYSAGETLCFGTRVANYGRSALSGALEWSLLSDSLHLSGACPAVPAPVGCLTDTGSVSVSLEGIRKPEKARLILRYAGVENEYPLWIYPEAEVKCPETVLECRSLDDRALACLAAGGRVYLTPDSTPEALPHSLKAQFSPDFWSVCTFPHQAGGMGQLIRKEHPLFDAFPTESWSEWQWWPMANGRALMLPERIDAIVTEMDSYAFLRPMAKLFECRCGGGRLMVSSLGLHQLQRYPEARALQRAIYAYMASDAFQPEQELSPEWIRSLDIRG